LSAKKYVFDITIHPIKHAVIKTIVTFYKIAPTEAGSG